MTISQPGIKSNIFYCRTGLVLMNAIATQDCIHDPTFRHSSPSVFIRGDLMLHSLKLNQCGSKICWIIKMVHEYFTTLSILNGVFRFKIYFEESPWSYHKMNLKVITAFFRASRFKTYSFD